MKNWLQKLNLVVITYENNKCSWRVMDEYKIWKQGLPKKFNGIEKSTKSRAYTIWSTKMNYL